MTGALLRTGTLKAFEPLGALGNPVYLAASQLRAAIGRRLGEDAADVLAIPHRNQDGDAIDWYAPRPGPVVPWSAATLEEREQAKEQLLGIRERIDSLGQVMQSEEAGERQVFGRLLEHVTSFPDDGHVYLVDGRPVITFWGFRHQDAPLDSNPLLNLDVAPDQPQTAEKRGGLSWWWLLPLLLLLAILLVWLLRGCGETPPQPVIEDRQEAPMQRAREPAEEQTPQEGEPTVDTPLEPTPPDDSRREELVVRDGTARILEQDRVETDHRTVVEGDRVEGLGQRLQDEVGSTDVVETEAGDMAIEASATDTEEHPDIAEMEAAALDPGEGEQETEVPPGDTTEGAADPDGISEQPPSEQPPEDSATPEQSGEPPETPEDGSASGEPPETGADDSAQPPPPPESPVPADAPQQGESGAPDAPADGAKSETGDAAAADGPAQSLNLPPAAVSRGSTQFLNGGWRTSTSLQDPRTALPVDMEYQLRDGAGRLSLKRADGSVCSGQVRAVIEEGKLVVQNARDIKCPDGTNFGRPRLECVPGEDGRADCAGRYETGEVFSVDIKKSQERTAADAAKEAATRKSDEEK